MTTHQQQAAALAIQILEQAALIGRTDAAHLDDLTVYDLDKAYRQFAAAVERTMADAKRRFDNGQMIPGGAR